MKTVTDGYLNLAFAVLGRNPDAEPLSIRESDINAINEVLFSLGEARAKIIKLRFGLGVDVIPTLKEIGEVMGVSSARTGQLEESALRILRHPSKSFVFKMLFRSYLESALRSNQKAVKELKEKVLALESELKRELMLKRLESTKSNLGVKSLNEIEVDSLELFPRTLRCLKEAEIKTLGELMKKSEKELTIIPGFGRKSLNELRDYLWDCGLELAKE